MTTSVERGWAPALGAILVPGGARFRVWAPAARRVELVLEAGGGAALALESDGCFAGFVPGVGAGERYRYLVDGRGPFPDPASRRQPEGVHGPSEVVDPGAYRWKAEAWRGLDLEDAVFYELHVGAFTPEGTFAAAAGKLPLLAELGVTAVELMPVADFPGARNWGYDGAAPFAPARCYGAPDDLRALADAAHALGLAVVLDVVYNHLGPDGNYTGAFSPGYFTDAHSSPWGAGVNLDRPLSAQVRRFFIENALHWLHEYRLDGLRLDATHAMVDQGPRHLVAELADRARASLPPGRRVLLAAEDRRTPPAAVRPADAGGWGLDAVWADDFHHQMRRILAGDDEGYFAGFTDRTEDLAAILRAGRREAGTEGIPLRRFVFCLQNHDQIGNRALGERLNAEAAPEAFRAAAALLLCAPETPLLFMGQEWGASAPFLYFTDHAPELGRRVTRGRRREFAAFRAFSDPAARALIPDPQAPETFARSRLDWTERERPGHRELRRLHQALLRLRRESLRGADWDARAAGPDAVLLEGIADQAVHLVVVRLRGEGEVETRPLVRPAGGWSAVLTTEDPAYAPDPRPAVVRREGPPSVRFSRPGAVVLRGRR